MVLEAGLHISLRGLEGSMGGEGSVVACKPLACLTPFQPAPRPSALTGSTGTSSTTAPFAGGFFPAGSTSVNSTLTFVGTCDGLPLTNCPWYSRSPCCTWSRPSPWAWSLRHSPYTSERSYAKKSLKHWQALKVWVAGNQFQRAGDLWSVHGLTTCPMAHCTSSSRKGQAAFVRRYTWVVHACIHSAAPLATRIMLWCSSARHAFHSGVPMPDPLSLWSYLIHVPTPVRLLALAVSLAIQPLPFIAARQQRTSNTADVSGA